MTENIGELVFFAFIRIKYIISAKYMQGKQDNSIHEYTHIIKL